MNVEMLGVKHFELAIAKTDYLEPHINDNDREPSWDGDVEVYRKAGNVHSKADLILKVPIQVKGHVSNNLKKKTISYPVDYTDLKNYLEEGGTVFVVVFVDTNGENHQIYYSGLLPYELKRMIKKNQEKNAKTKNITLVALPKNKDDISDVFLGFARDMKKQRPAIYSEEVSFEDLVNAGTIPELSFGFSCVPGRNNSPIDLLLKGNVYLYAKLPHGIELPVEHLETVEMTSTILPAKVTVNGKQFYSEYEVVYKKDAIEHHFGKSIKHIIDRKNNSNQKFSFALQGSLTERICDEEFIIDAIESRRFEVNGRICQLNEAADEIAAFNTIRLQEHLNWLKTVRDILVKLDASLDLDCSCLTDRDEGNLKLLKKTVIDGEAIALNIAGSTVGFFDIGNLKMLICAIEDEEKPKLFRVYNANDTNIEVKATDHFGDEYMTSYYVLLKKDEILSCCNLNFNKIVMQLKQIPASETFSGQLVLLLLELIKAYDDSKPKREDILDGAHLIAKWLKETDKYTPKEVLELNYFQIIKRMRPFCDNEIQCLLDIVESKHDLEEIYTGAYLLLSNQDAAALHYRKMTSEQQKHFREYPIFYFWKDCKKENE